MKAPIVIFAYKRIDSLKKCIETLKKNRLSSESDLYIFSDAAKYETDKQKVNDIRVYIKQISGFKSLTIINAEVNQGLAISVINGVSDVINIHGKVIVIEDDLKLATNFLDFMNQALDEYEKQELILSISGFTLPMKKPVNYPYDVYFTKRVFSWGWATWKHKWNNIDWEVNDYWIFAADQNKQKAFNAMGTDLSSMLHRQMKGEISSWAIRWCYHQFKHSLFTVFPVSSKVINDGFNSDATHSGLNTKRYKTSLGDETQTRFNFAKTPHLHPFFVSQFVRHFSLPVRAYYKLTEFINKRLTLLK